MSSKPRTGKLKRRDCQRAVCANTIFLVKETSVFSAAALADLMFVTKDLIGIYYKTDEALEALE